MDLQITSEGGPPVTVRIDVRYLPDYYMPGPMQGRADIKAGRKIGSVYDTQDLEAAVRKFAEVPGAYYAAAFSGREVSHSDVFHVELRGQQLVIGDESSKPASGASSQPAALTQFAAPAAAAVPVPENAAARELNNAAQTVEAVKGLIQTVSPSAPVAPITREDLERATKEAAREAVEQYKAAQPAPASVEKPRTLVEQAKEIKEAAAVLGIGAQPAVSAHEQPDLLSMLRQAREAKEVLRDEIEPESAEDRGLLGQVFSLFDTGLKTVDRALQSPTGQRLAGMLVAKYAPGAQPQQNGAQPNQQQQQANTTQPATMLPPVVASTLNLIALDARRDAPVDRAADAIGSAAEADAELAEMLTQIKATPSALLVEQVAQLTGHSYLTDLPHVCAWFDSLREELTARAQGEGNEGDDDGGQNEAAAVASNNGHKNAATVAQT